MGFANPKQVYDTVAHMLDKFPDVQWLAHIHNHRDPGLANVLAVAETVRETVPHPLNSALLTAGRPWQLMPAPERQVKIG